MSGLGRTILGSLRKDWPEFDLRRVVDAPLGSLLQFTITKKDCQLGVPDDPYECPAVFGISRATLADFVKVSMHVVYVGRGHTVKRWRHSGHKLPGEMNIYDRLKTRTTNSLTPGTYLLRAPSKSERIDRPPSKTTGRKNHRINGGSKHVSFTARVNKSQLARQAAAATRPPKRRFALAPAA